MKKVFRAAVAAFLILILLTPAAALAEGASSGLLSVDNQHTYPGMDKTYADGYMPIISEGKLHVVMPLRTYDEIYNRALTVTPQLGAPGTSPFKPGNYILTVNMNYVPIDTGENAVPVYLVDLWLPLAEGRTAGTYLLTLDVAYEDIYQNDMKQSFPLYVTVDGKSAGGAGGGLLSIDNQHVYPGMEKSYDAGYVPTEADNKVRVMMPLVAADAVKGNAVTVTPDLGAAGATPFVLGNYVKKVQLATVAVDNGASSVSAFVVEMSLTLLGGRTKGTYPITLNVAYQDASGAEMKQSFPLFVTVSGKTPGASGTLGILSIDNKHVYSGMNKSYSAGYSPTVSGSKARVVLPLVASEAIKGGAVTVTPNLGAPGSSPFVFGNYIETVKFASHTVSVGSVSAYLIDLTLPLASGRTRGSFPVAISVAYQDESGSDAQQTFTLFVTVNGKDPNAPPPTEAPRHQPKVIVSEYAVNPSPVTAGQGFTLDFTLANTSESYDLTNIKLTLKSGSADLYPADNKNTFYYTSLAKGADLDVSVPMMSKVDATTDPHSVTVTVEYEDDKAVSFTSSEDIPVTISQKLRVEFDTPNVPVSMTAGDTAPFTLQIINKGRSTVYNVMCVLKAPGLLPEASAFLGNIDAGTAKPAQIMVFAGTKDMTGDGSADGTDQFGKTQGAITITYEDEFGKQYSGTVDIATTVDEPVVPAATQVPSAQPKASQWWISALIVAALATAAAAALLIGRRHRAGKVRSLDAK